MRHSPRVRYQQLIDSGAFSKDPLQLPVVQALDELWHALQQPPTSLIDRVRRRAPTGARGLYLWGSVGRGKTWLMDLFYDCLPAQRKRRTHFHRFMQKIHQDLGDLGRVRNPLDRISADWARQTDVLCLDEFFVTDIADAMLLANLFESLFARGVTLVTTSNIPPDDLYRDGLQRAKFLPAIELIKQRTRVLHLPGDTDFRLRILEQSEIYHHPLDNAADQVMTRAFDRMTAASEMNHELEINGRNFHAHRRGDGVIWFEFGELCEKPRGAIDYIEIARAFNTVVVSNMPQLTDEAANATRRFITLVDEFYDRNVKLLLSAEVPLKALYRGHKMAFEFERTTSRLTEMQSHDYLARPHLP